jgi:hypothetical protein
MLEWSHAGQGSIMDTSEALLTSVAIRLAVILVVGLIARNAAADLPHREIPCASARTVIADVQAPAAARPEPDQTMRDMMLHD